MHGLSASLWRLWRGARNSVTRLVVQQPLRGLSMLLVLGVVWVLLGGLFWTVLRFLEQEQYIGFKERLVESLLGVFFFALFFLVAVSDVVVVWSGLFRSRAAIYQAQTPIGDRALFWTAALEGGAWSSWAVLVLALPLVGTITAEAVQPARFAPAALAALAGFVLCSLAFGSLGALALARLIPLLRRGIKGIIALVVAAVAVSALLTLGGMGATGRPASFMQQVVGRLAFTESPLLPSAWTQQAFMAARAGRWGDWLHHVLLLFATAAAVAIVAEAIAGRRLRRELDLLTGRPERTVRSDRAGRPWRALPLLPADLGLLAAKDLRLFLRDPAQILQFTMFFGLLGFYLLMLPRLGKAFLFDEAWRPAVSLLNLTAIAMALATFTGRFVYPLLSLEGRRLWVLVLAPFPRQRVVTAKFAFALAVGMPVSVLLVALSGAMLELPLPVICYQVGVIAAMSCGLSAGALGIGARFADYGEDNPGKLVAGYGGNVNLLASLVFTGLLVGGATLPLIHQAPWAWLAGGAWTAGVAAAWTWGWLSVAWRWFARS
jgi:ABC-2 type transport system permease protein